MKLLEEILIKENENKYFCISSGNIIKVVCSSKNKYFAQTDTDAHVLLDNGHYVLREATENEINDFNHRIDTWHKEINNFYNNHPKYC